MEKEQFSTSEVRMEGLTWSDRLSTPANWSTSLETPTIHRVKDPFGKKRLILWSGLYPARLATSEDDGANWSELQSAGDWGGIVVMGSVVARSKKGEYIALFHDDGRYFKKGVPATKPPTFTLYQTESVDGGLHWSEPHSLYTSDQIHLCEPGIVRSPDNKQWAVLLRENRRERNSHVIFSTDEGEHWSVPKELPASLTGDRHTAVATGDGRYFISFRDMAIQDSAPTGPLSTALYPKIRVPKYPREVIGSVGLEPFKTL